MDLAIGFLSGVGVSIVGAVIADILARRREQRRIVEERRFGIYMKLMEIYGSYFWFTVAEMQGEQVGSEVRRRCRDLAWQCADMLRSADEVDYLEDILDVTLGPRFSTARERYDAIGQLLDRLGKRVNPRYARKIREISSENVANLAAGGHLNAPGAT